MKFVVFLTPTHMLSQDHIPQQSCYKSNDLEGRFGLLDLGSREMEEEKEGVEEEKTMKDLGSREMEEEKTMEIDGDETSNSAQLIDLLRGFLSIQQRRAEAYAKLRRYLPFFFFYFCFYSIKFLYCLSSCSFI